MKKVIKKAKKVESAEVETKVVAPPVLLPAKVYQVPETRGDYLALAQCVRDAGCQGVGDLEVRASRL